MIAECKEVSSDRHVASAKKSNDVSSSRFSDLSKLLKEPINTNEFKSLLYDFVTHANQTLHFFDGDTGSEEFEKTYRFCQSDDHIYICLHFK